MTVVMPGCDVGDMADGKGQKANKNRRTRGTQRNAKRLKKGLVNAEDAAPAVSSIAFVRSATWAEFARPLVAGMFAICHLPFAL